MLSCRAIALAILLAGAFGSHRASAADMTSPPEALRPQAPCARPAASRAPGSTPRIALMGQPPLTTTPTDAAPPPTNATPGRSPALQPLNAPAPWTLDDLERIAWESNPTLVQARMAVRAAQGRYAQARLYPNPTIGYSSEDVGIDGTSGQQGMVVGQEFVTSGKRPLGMEVASWEVQQARHGLEAQQWRVLNDIRAGYYDVLVAQRMVDLNEELVRVGREGVEVTEKLKASMEVSQADVLQARIEAETAALGLYQARQQLAGTWRRLAAVLGRPETEPRPLEGQLDRHLPEFTWEDSLRELLARSPELARARAGVRRARSEVALQTARRRPNFEVGLGAKYDASALGTLADVEFIVPLPLFDRNQGGIIEAQAGLTSQEREVRRIELDLHRRLAEVFQQYANAQHEVTVYTNTILPNAKASLDLVATGYREGEFGYLMLLTAQRTFFAVNLNYLTSLRELWARIVEIQGMLLAGGLERPDQ